MNKKTKIITIVCFAIIFLISIILEGVSFSTNKFVFSTKYYKTSRKAFEKEDNTIVIQEDICLYDFNESNSFYVTMTEDGQIIISKMFCKNECYFYTGDYFVYNLDSSNLFLDDNYNESVIFNKKGFFEKKIFWNLLIVEERMVDNESNFIYTYQIDNTDYYVYFNIKQNYIGFFELAYEYYEKLL